MKNKVYDKLDLLPDGKASDVIRDGCLVLEGGGWKGLYTLGVIDCLMQNDLNFRTTVGTSAGALSAVGYVAGQIGWGARIDLKYRHDKNYCGLKALRKEGGITGFSYLFNEIIKTLPLDTDRLNDPQRRLAVAATNLLTGKNDYFIKGQDDILLAAQASATVPFVSKPVYINGVPYLDGGCAEKIPIAWAKTCGEKKIIVVRTRELAFRRKEKPSALTKIAYKKYPEFVKAFNSVNARFNKTVVELENMHERGEIFLMAPSKVVTVTRFDGDMQKLGDLYWLGYNDTLSRLDALRRYLED